MKQESPTRMATMSNQLHTHTSTHTHTLALPGRPLGFTRTASLEVSLQGHLIWLLSAVWVSFHSQFRGRWAWLEITQQAVEATGGWRKEGTFLPREAAGETATHHQHQRLHLHLHGTENSACHSQLGSEGPSEGPVTASGPRWPPSHEAAPPGSASGWGGSLQWPGLRTSPFGRCHHRRQDFPRVLGVEELAPQPPANSKCHCPKWGHVQS